MAAESQNPMAFGEEKPPTPPERALIRYTVPSEGQKDCRLLQGSL